MSTRSKQYPAKINVNRVELDLVITELTLQSLSDRLTSLNSNHDASSNLQSIVHTILLQTDREACFRADSSSKLHILFTPQGWQCAFRPNQEEQRP